MKNEKLSIKIYNRFILLCCIRERGGSAAFSAVGAPQLELLPPLVNFAPTNGGRTKALPYKAAAGECAIFGRTAEANEAERRRWRIQRGGVMAAVKPPCRQAH